MCWLIVEMTEADQWAPHYGSRLIPEARRPTVVQPSREVAEQEARRLASRHPDKRFVVFEAVAAGVTVRVPSHITVGGTVFAERKVPTIVAIADPDLEIPF